MTYFTPDLYAQLQRFDETSMDAADAAWETAAQQYEAHLQALGEAVKPLQDKFAGILLHDALVLSIFAWGDRFTIVLRKDIPPQDVVTLTYSLTAQPFIDKAAVPAERCAKVMWFEYDEYDVVRRGNQTFFQHSILFSNGWEIRLQFADVQVVLAEPVYPAPPTVGAAATPRRLPRTA